MKDGFDHKTYKLMVKACYDFTAHTEFKSLKIHEQPELSSTQKKLLQEEHVIPVSRKGLGYKSPESICITRKGKEKVVNSNRITIEEVNSMEEKEGSERGEGEISCHHITIIEESEIETPEEDAEDGGQSTVGKLKEVNLGTIEEPRATFISTSISSEDKGKYMSLPT
ncbi:uncharacterized protein E5676_scaffold1441G00060 [Cucumis melo var. makuwa]|uniref:Gypsy-like retrotransposase n=1 Tax=Cucumis melo var. makuwa TaxID=1194695 RepID=A0A5D3DQK3_CUCMM|nr:uncharacterized protein E5676_scaffold1441G00060 [Cucumis melo var. makuwa]